MKRGVNNRNERAHNKKEWGKLGSPGGSRQQGRTTPIYEENET
jgi:hypothetical protein